MLAVGLLRERGQVERMERLPQLEQDVVGHVDDVVDGARAQSGDALDKPVRGRTHLDVADDARRVARAQLGLVDLYRDEVGDLLVVERPRHLAWRLVAPRDVVHRAHLARKALHGQAVGTVRRDLEVEHRVREALPLGELGPERRVFGQHHDARVVAANAQLACRADHAVALDAAKLGFLDLDVAGQHRANRGDGDLLTSRDVGGAADDLRGLLAVAKVDGRDVHMVAIGVRLAGEHVSDLDALQVGAHLADALDAGAGQVEPVTEVLQPIGDLDHRVEPFKRN